jgi:hypothetical protein
MDKQSIMNLIDDLNVGKGFLIAIGDLYYQTEIQNLYHHFGNQKLMRFTQIIFVMFLLIYPIKNLKIMLLCGNR